MKTQLLMLILFLGFTEISAQQVYVPGTIVKGKNVAYRCMEESRFFLRVRNVNNVDTTPMSYYEDGRIVGREEDMGVMSDADTKTLYEVFQEVLTDEEWNQLKGRRGGSV